MGEGSQRVYDDGEFDMLALVALDVRRIAYMAPSMSAQTIHIRPIDAAYTGKGRGVRRGKRFEDFPFVKALEEIA